MLLWMNLEIHRCMSDTTKSRSLLQRYEGPFNITKKVGKVAYKIQLPPRLPIHLVFHIPMLKKYKADLEDPLRNTITRQPPSVNITFTRDISKILAHKVIDRGGHHNMHKHIDFLIRWGGNPLEVATWHPERDLWQFKEHIARYLTTLPTRMPDSPRGGECHRGNDNTMTPFCKEKRESTLGGALPKERRSH